MNGVPRRFFQDDRRQRVAEGRIRHLRARNRDQRIVNEDREDVGIAEVGTTVDRSARGRAIRVARNVVPDPAAMREQLAQRRGMVRLRERRHISADARIEVHDTFLGHDRRERRGDRLGAAACSEPMAGGGGNAELEIDLAIGFGKRQNASPVRSH